MGLDRFREINHTFGPLYGDALLRDVARRFARVTDGSNARARLNGDEFAALFPDVTTADVEAICADILRALDFPSMALGVPVDISGSIGAALFLDHGEKSSLLFQRDDSALDQAKHFGRGYAVYEPENDPYSQKNSST